MPKGSRNLCVDDLRHAEYYGMQPTFDELYQRSRDGGIFDNLMDLITHDAFNKATAFMIPGGSIPKQRWEVCSMKKPWVSLTDVVFHYQMMS